MAPKPAHRIQRPHFETGSKVLPSPGMELVSVERSAVTGGFDADRKKPVQAKKTMYTGNEVLMMVKAKNKPPNSTATTVGHLAPIRSVR